MNEIDKLNSQDPMQKLGESLCKLMKIPFPPTNDTLDRLIIGIKMRKSIADWQGRIVEGYVEDLLSAVDSLEIFVSVEEEK